MLAGVVDSTVGLYRGSRAPRRAADSKVPGPTRLHRVRGCRVVSNALPEAMDTMSSGVDILTADLILRSASQRVATTADAHVVSTLFHSINHAIGANSFFQMPHAAGGLPTFSDLPSADLSSLPQDVSVPLSHLHTATLPMDSSQVDPNVVSAANQGMQDLVASYSHAASSASSSVDHTLGVLGGLTQWATDRLSVVQSIDPDSYNSLSSSLTSIIDGLNAAIESDTNASAEHYTKGLVLGVQQLVTGLSEDDGVTIQNMMAGQETVTGGIKAPGVDKAFLIQLSMAAIAAIVASIPSPDWEAKAAAAQPTNPEDDVVPLRYNPQDLAMYFSRRPVAVMQRCAEVAKYFCAFVGSLLIDARTGVWEKNMPSRAKWLREIAEDLGPTYIKFVQAASTRVDMVPEAYLKEFSKLQDNVPTFSTAEARVVLEEGLGKSVDQVFDWISQEPLAAASLGQVYRGKLRDDWGGEEVAIKVQRPGVLESAALDIHVMRRACLLFSKLPGMSDQWACALDDWAYRFFQEMDYQLEAFNTLSFQRDMASLQGIMIANVHPELTSRKVIVTDWIKAERLADTSDAEVRGMCATLLNCYLIQLLETGLLHADPHPGNLMRTPEGKIVILDFGLVTEVREDQRIALVEFISHLLMENWEAVARDLVKLGFMPGGLPPGVSATDLAPFLKTVMGQLVKGGGIRGGINIMEITGELEGVARSYNLCIPPYFALVLRAFAVIEGIALTADPEYAIVHQCLPYLSRRLLTDSNPRMRAALKEMLYGDSTRLDIDRLQRLMGAFSSFTTGGDQFPVATGPTFSAATGYSPSERFISGAGSAPNDGPVISEAVREALKVVFAEDGSYAQELLVEELVAATDAMSRDALSQALRMVISSASTVTALRSLEMLGPLRVMLLPPILPMEMISSMQPVVALSNEDRQALHTLRSVLDILQPPANAMPEAMSNSSRAIRAAGEMMPLLPELLPGVRVTLELFLRQLVRRMALRLAEDLGPGRQPVALPSGSTVRPAVC